MKKWLLAVVACLILVAASSAPGASARLISDDMQIFSNNGLIAGVVPFDGYPDVAHITVFGFSEGGPWIPSGAYHPTRLTGTTEWELRSGMTVCGTGEGYWGGMGVMVNINNYATAGLMKDPGLAKDPDKLHMVVTLRKQGKDQFIDYGPIENKSYECGAVFAPMYRVYAKYHPVTKHAEFGLLDDSDGKTVVASGIIDWISDPLAVWFGAGKGAGDYVSVDHAVPNVFLSGVN